MASSKGRGKKTARAKGKTPPKAMNKTKAKAKTAARPAKPAPRKAAAAPKASSKGLALTSAGPSFTSDSVEKSLAWYRDVLGCTVGQRWEENGQLLGVELKAGSVVFMISQDDWSKGRHRIKGAGFRIYCETTQDIDRLAEGIQSRGGTLTDPPQDGEWGRSFSVQDPDGFKITISQER